MTRQPRLYSALAFLLFAPLSLVGCADDDTVLASSKGEVDSDALSSGATVVLGGGRGAVTVPFIMPVPEASDDELVDALDGSVSFTVSSNQTGTTADLASGTLVTGAAPSAPGQWTFELNEFRDVATLTFVNQSGPLTLKTDRDYSGSLSITPNDYIESIASFTIPVDVSGG